MPRMIAMPCGGTLIDCSTTIISTMLAPGMPAEPMETSVAVSTIMAWSPRVRSML